MRRHLFSRTLLLISLCGLTILAGASSQFVQDMIRIESDRLVYRDKSARIPLRREDLFRLFGPASREVFNVAGNVLIWDELGLSCYGCQAPQAEPEEFQYMSEAEIKNYRRTDYIGTLVIYVRKYNPYPEQDRRLSHKPHLPFPGYIRLQGVDIDGRNTISRYTQQREGKQTILLPENSFSFFVRCEPEPHEITLHTIRDKYDSDYLTIYSVGLRNIGHFYRKISCLEVFESGEPPPELVKEEPVQAVEPPITPMLQAE